MSTAPALRAIVLTLATILAATAATATRAPAQNPPAQNLIVNGDFEQLPPIGWTLLGPTTTPTLLSFDTSGSGASLGFSCRPGCPLGGPNPCSPAMLGQTVTLTKNAEYLLVADLAAINTLGAENLDAGTVDISIGPVSLATAAFGTIRPYTTERRRIAVPFRAQADGPQQLAFAFTRQWGSNSSTPRHHVDNVALLRAPQRPIMVPDGERRTGGTMHLRTIGSPQATIGVFIATRLGPPIEIPGFSGGWRLGGVQLLLLIGQANALGEASFPIPLQQAIPIAGVELHWQTIEIGAGQPQIGMPTSFAVYD